MEKVEVIISQLPGGSVKVRSILELPIKDVQWKNDFTIFGQETTLMGTNSENWEKSYYQELPITIKDQFERIAKDVERYINHSGYDKEGQNGANTKNLG